MEESNQVTLPSTVDPIQSIEPPKEGVVRTARGGEVYYEHKLIRRGGPYTAPVYRTHLWIYTNGKKYNYGEFDGRLSSDEISNVFVGSLQGASETTQGGQRRSLDPIRDRGKFLNPRTSQRAGYKPFG